MWNNIGKILCILGAVCLLASESVQAQSNLSSPYSAFGLGRLYHSNNMRSHAMGKTGIAMRDYFTINVKNPASYAAFDSTSFVFEGSLHGNITTMSSTDFREQYSYASLDHLLFGFPVTNWWRSSFGLLPFSGMGYRVFDTEVVDEIGKIQYEFEGEGGLSQFFWGNAFRIGENLSVGVNAAYLFGSLDKIHRVAFPDSAYLLNTKFDNQLTIKDLKLDFGIQYYKKIRNDLDLIAGAVYRPETNLSATRNRLARTYRGSASGVDFILDTISMTGNESGKVTLPAGYGAGISLARKNNWMVAIDYSFDNWKKFALFGENDSLVNSHMLSFGAQVIPDANSLSYYKRIDYRFGLNYTLSQLKINDENITGFGITFGTGLPLRGTAVRGTRSMINLGFEYGTFGTTGNNLIRENYMNVMIGVTVYEWWFFKRRYN